MRGLLWLALFPAFGTAQDLVVNYLGGATSAGQITERAAIGVSPDGRFLYVTQAAQGVVLRYNLRTNTVDRFAVRGLAESTFSNDQSVTTIGVHDDGAALIPLGSRVARLELDGSVTVPGHRFEPSDASTSTEPAVLSAFAFPASVPATAARTAAALVFGTQMTQRRFWYALVNRTNYLGALASCTTSFPPCDNSALPAGAPSGNFRSAQPWGLAFEVRSVGTAQQLQLYFTDTGRTGNSGNYGTVASIISGALTVLAHPAMASLPAGSSGARLSRPSGLVLDGSRNLLVADTGNHRILRRTPEGVWSVFAGTGVRGSSGDGGPAVKAQLYEPRSLTMDAAGTLYVHDSGNGLLRRVLPNGIIERIDPGNGETLVQDLRLTAAATLATDSSGQIYAYSQARIVKIDPAGRTEYIAGNGQFGKGGEGVTALDAPMEPTSGITVDAKGGVIYGEQFRIRRVDPSGFVNTIAGNGSQASVNRSGYDGDPVAALDAFLEPRGVAAIAPGDSLLILDGTARVRRLHAGAITSVTGVPWCGGTNDTSRQRYADGVPAIFVCAGANGGQTSSVVGARDGYLYFDDGGVAVRVIDPEGFIATRATLNGMQVASMAPGPNSSLYALVYRRATENYLLVRIEATGEVKVLTSDIPSRELPPPVRPGQASTELRLSGSGGLATDSRGFVYVSDQVSRRILVFGEPVSVEVDSLPSGLSVLVDNVPVTTPHKFLWTPGDYHTVTADPELAGGAFAGWSHAPSGSPPKSTVTWMPAGGVSRVVARYGEDAPPETARPKRQ